LGKNKLCKVKKVAYPLTSGGVICYTLSRRNNLEEYCLFNEKKVFMDLKSRISQLKKLKQYEGKSKAELEKIALEIEKYKVDWVGLSSSEKKRADSLYRDYIDNYHLETFSDKEDLKVLVYNTALLERIQKKIEKIEKATKKRNGIGTLLPKDVIDSLNNIQKQILILKEKLGLFIDKKDESWLDFWGKLKKKFSLYVNEHKGAFTMKCPYCGEYVLLTRKIEDYDAIPFTMFKGTVLYNEKLMQLIEQGKLTEKEVAEIFGLQSVDYIKGIFQKIYLREKKSS
jgi:hypothetical protein